MESVEAVNLVKRFKHKPIPKDSGLPDISRIYRLTFQEAYDPVQVAALFSKDPNVEYAETEPKMQIYEVPNDPMYGLQQHLPQVMAEEAWDIHKGENGTEEVVIAFIDTGVDWYHEDLTANSWQNLGEDADGDGHTIETDNNGQPILDPDDQNGIDDDGNDFIDDLIGWDFYEAQQTGNGSDPAPNPGNSVGFHGTHCAGIAAAVTDNGIGVSGISWNCSYMGLMCDINNDLTFAWDGIIYAADNGADVISNSWGGFSWYYREFLTDILDYANGLGSIVVAARGNENDDAFGHPSCYPGVIAVASVMTNDVKNSYSSYGLSVDVSAPGGGLGGLILSTEPGNTYNYEAGTSMACPLVAGLLGLVKSYHPEWTKDQVVNQVIATCDNIDDINPGFVNQLGSGRINAYNALANDYTSPQQELKMEMLGCKVTDSDNDGKLMSGDTGTISVTLRNYTHGVSTDAVHISISTDDSQIIVLNNNFTAAINSDRVYDFDEILQFTVSPDATSHAVALQLEIDADIPVIVNEPMIIPVVVNPHGFFVYEKMENGRDYSGSFIRQYLEDRGYEVTYSNYFPQSLLGYEATFISLGNLVFPKWNPGTYLTQEMTQVVVDYMMSGGKMYAEGGGLFIIPNWLEFSNAEMLENLFGLQTISYFDKQPIDTLSGVEGTIFEGIKFSSSSQYNNNWIQRVYPKTGVVAPLKIKLGSQKVAIYNTGEFGQKTFYFSYSLADLKDVDITSSRYNFLNKVMETMGYELPEDYLIANFTADALSGGVNDEVSFKDISLTNDGVDVISWQWDFQNDGIIDNFDKDPTFTYTMPGSYDVRYIISDGEKMDTILQKNFYTVNNGVFVFEGIEGSREMSGAWMRDFMQNNGYDVHYFNSVPRYIDGYDALFLSFGSYYIASINTVFDDGFGRMVRNYISKGGKVYLEGECALSIDQAGPETWNAFGLQNATNQFPNPFPFDTIIGWPGSISEGINFYGTNQLCNDFADKYFPNEEGMSAYYQPGFGNLAVQRLGENGEKTFCFSYALAELQDGESTREDLFGAILEYFDMAVGVKNQPDQNNQFSFLVYPNPIKNHFFIGYNLEKEALVKIELYNITGTLVQSITQQTNSAGKHQMELNTAKLQPGLYFIRMQAGNQIATKKVVKL
jgi:PKD repeat protein